MLPFGKSHPQETLGIRLHFLGLCFQDKLTSQQWLPQPHLPNSLPTSLLPPMPNPTPS